MFYFTSNGKVNKTKHNHMFEATLRCQKDDIFLFYPNIFRWKQDLSWKISGVIFGHILKKFIYSRFNLHLLTYTVIVFDNSFVKFQTQHKDIFRALICIFCKMWAEKILVWIVDIKSQEQDVAQISTVIWCKKAEKILNLSIHVFWKFVKGGYFNF